MNNKINLVLASDQNYVQLLVPCIVSILYNKKTTTAIDIYILQSGLNDYHQQKIKELERFNNITNCKIKFINTDEHKLFKNLAIERLETRKRYSSFILYKLFVPKLFSNLDKILHIDVDTIIRCDLLDFYNQDLKDNYCAAIKYNAENYMEVEQNYNGELVKVRDVLTEIGVPNNVNYFVQGGVILFNIKQIILDNKQVKLESYGIQYKDTLGLIDESVLTATFLDRVSYIETLYNFDTLTVDYFNSYLNKEEQQEFLKSLKQAKIFHYINQVKPNRLSRLNKIFPLAYREFYKYYQMSYLRINPIKLQFTFLFANLKRFRCSMFGTKTTQGGKKVFYFLGLEFVVRKGS